jgi:hypothetical protein
MAITTTLTMDDLLGISPQAQLNLNRVLTWINEVNATVGANTAELRVVASTAACKAIAAADRANLDVVFLADSGQALYFSAASSAAEALGPPITVIQPTAGTGRWLALALPPVASVAAAQLATNAVETLKINALAVTEAKIAGAAITATKLGIASLAAPSSVAVGGASYIIPLTIPNTAGNSDYTLPAIGLIVIGARFVPNATVGALSTIQLKTAAGAANVTEALDIAAATVGLAKDFTTFDPANWNFAASAGIRVTTTGTDVAGSLMLECLRVS